jgi:type VI secretion system protein ImpG
MDPKFLRYYNREVQHIREMCGEFAKEHPKIAGRLGVEGLDCADPYVERLLEGFGYMAARVQLKVDDEFPRFTQNLLEIVYPHFLAPLPSMAMVQFVPDLDEGSLAEGFTLPRHTALRGHLGKNQQTSCTYLTANEIELWPIELIEAEYLASTAEVAALGVSNIPGIKAGLRIRLKLGGDLKFCDLPLDRLTFYLSGVSTRPVRLYEQMMANALGIVLQSAERPASWREILPSSKIQSYGFEDDQALLPYGPRSFQGYRLLQEYFALPERCLMVQLCDLQKGVRRCDDGMMDIIIPLNQAEIELEKNVDRDQFKLFCTPAINLFEKRTDRIHLDDSVSEYHVIPDRSRPLDFEVFDVLSVDGFGTGTEDKQEFLPFYSLNDQKEYHRNMAHYTINRQQRVPSGRMRRKGPRSSYIGSEVFLMLVDGNDAPYSSELRQLGLKVRCTNRDLPLLMPVGIGDTDFNLDTGGPIKSVRCLAGPTKPRHSHAQQDIAWKLISHLSLNYLSITDSDNQKGAAALKQLLGLYGVTGEAYLKKQVDGLLSVKSKPIHRRLPIPGPMSYGRGLEIELTFDESAFEGSGIFPLGKILEIFFSKYVSINSFTETVLKTLERGEIKRWPARIGQRHVL